VVEGVASILIGNEWVDVGKGNGMVRPCGAC
jgi:hypothetical protein